jgi:hypothetical protein
MEVIDKMLDAKKVYLNAVHSFDKNLCEKARNIYIQSLDKLSVEQLNEFYPIDNPIIKQLQLEEATLLLESYNDSAVSSYLIQRGVELFKPFDQIAFLGFILFLAPNDFHAQELRKTFHSILKTHAELFFYSTDNFPQNLEIFSDSKYKELGYLLIIDSIKNGANTLELMNAIYQNKKLVSYLEQDCLLDIYFEYNKTAFKRELALLDFTQHTKPDNFGVNYLIKAFENNAIKDYYAQAFLNHDYKENYFSAEDFKKVCEKNPQFLDLLTQTINELFTDKFDQENHSSLFKATVAVMFSTIEKKIGKISSIDFEKLAFHILDNAPLMTHKEMAQQILAQVQTSDLAAKKTLKL